MFVIEICYLNQLLFYTFVAIGRFQSTYILLCSNLNHPTLSLKFKLLSSSKICIICLIEFMCLYSISYVDSRVSSDSTTFLPAQ